MPTLPTPQAIPTCMKRRLLYAASQAYQPQMEVHARSVGWIEPPVVVRREGMIGHRTIDLALVGRVTEGVVVAFRGTLPPFFAGDNDGWSVLLDWLNDGMSLCVESPDYGGGVHMGFAESTRRLWDDGEGTPGVRTAVEARLAQSRADGRARRHLFVTGHSKGGALANLTAYRAARVLEWRDMGVSVATFAAARAGNAAFARAYDASRIACLRYEIPADLVPHLPPGPHTPHWVNVIARGLVPRLAATDYHPVGLRVSTGEATHKPWSGTRRRLPRLLGRRGRGLEALVPGVLTAHAICPDSAYDALVCTGEDCDHGHGAAAALRA
ncbi:MAG: hypothetical protein V4574_04630 [Pseudomonadota bacterium]